MPAAFVALVMAGVGLASLAHRATGEAKAALQITGFFDLFKAESSMLSYCRSQQRPLRKPDNKK
jgi:hypothetical protein